MAHVVLVEVARPALVRCSETAAQSTDIVDLTRYIAELVVKQDLEDVTARLRLFNLRLFSLRLFNLRLFSLRLFNLRLFNLRLFSLRLFNLRLFSLRLFNLRLLLQLQQGH
jgi:hypothetical protein